MFVYADPEDRPIANQNIYEFLALPTQEGIDHPNFLMSDGSNGNN